MFLPLTDCFNAWALLCTILQLVVFVNNYNVLWCLNVFVLCFLLLVMHTLFLFFVYIYMFISNNVYIYTNSFSLCNLCVICVYCAWFSILGLISYYNWYRHLYDFKYTPYPTNFIFYIDFFNWTFSRKSILMHRWIPFLRTLKCAIKHIRFPWQGPFFLSYSLR